MTAVLRKSRPSLPLETMKKLYKGFILPHLECYASFLLGIGKDQAKRMEDANF